MTRPLFAAGHVLLAALFSMPSCGKTERAAPAAPAGVQPGQPAPDIDARDLEGQSFALSEHRGKVVVVSFWASWCPPCRALFPHERELVNKYQDRRFVFLGVNGDHTPEQGKAAQDRHGLNWRSFWNDGTIADRYGVSAWPTTYVIDARGVVRNRYEGPQPEAVERAVMTLLGELGEKQ